MSFLTYLIRITQMKFIETCNSSRVISTYDSVSSITLHAPYYIHSDPGDADISGETLFDNSAEENDALIDKRILEYCWGLCDNTSLALDLNPYTWAVDLDSDTTVPKADK